MGEAIPFEHKKAIEDVACYLVRNPLSFRSSWYLDGRQAEASDVPAEPAPAKRRCSPSWARLISKVYQADPRVCKGCGSPLKIVAYINDQISIKRILNHLGLSPAGAGKAAADPRAGPCAGGRRGPRDPGTLSTTTFEATFEIDARPAKAVVSPSTQPERC